MIRDWLLFILVLVILITPVYAGESYDVDFNSARTQSVELYEGDEVRFEMFGDTHSLILEEIGSTNFIKFDIVPFIKNGTKKVSSGILSLDTIMKVDLDRDGETDVSVALYSISSDSQALIVLQDNSEDNEITGDVTTGLVGEEETKSSNSLYYIIGALVVLGIAYMIYKNSSEDSEKKEDSEEKFEDEKNESENSKKILDVDPLENLEEEIESENQEQKEDQELEEDKEIENDSSDKV